MLEVGVCLNHELFTDQNKEVNKQKKMPQKKNAAHQGVLIGARR